MKTITERIAERREQIEDDFARENRDIAEADDLISMQDMIRTLKARISTLEDSGEFHECEIAELNGSVSLLTAELEHLPRLHNDIIALETRHNEAFELIMTAIQNATTQAQL